MSWTTPDIAGLIEQLRIMVEMGTSSGSIGGATLSSMVGSYEVPLGGVLRRPDVTGATQGDEQPTPTAEPIKRKKKFKSI